MTVDAHPAREIDRCQCLSHTGQVTTAPELQTRPPLPLAEACCPPLLRQPITADQADELARLLKALADPTRLRLVSLVAAHEGGEACVCELTEPLGLTQPTISHHLKILVTPGSSPATSAASGPTTPWSSQPWTPSPRCYTPDTPRLTDTGHEQQDSRDRHDHRADGALSILEQDGY
jgi:ArsR family transcriptional regulator, arsenate/arsenite/antimonite-responsive transcriptional repressor